MTADIAHDAYLPREIFCTEQMTACLLYTSLLRPSNTGAATSALFEMKKGAAFSVRQDQQNDAQIFVILFSRKMQLPAGKTPFKKGTG